MTHVWHDKIGIFRVFGPLHPRPLYWRYGFEILNQAYTWLKNKIPILSEFPAHLGEAWHVKIKSGFSPKFNRGAKQTFVCHAFNRWDKCTKFGMNSIPTHHSWTPFRNLSYDSICGRGMREKMQVIEKRENYFFGFLPWASAFVFFYDFRAIVVWNQYRHNAIWIMLIACRVHTPALCTEKYETQILEKKMGPNGSKMWQTLFIYVQKHNGKDPGSPGPLAVPFPWGGQKSSINWKNTHNLLLPLTTCQYGGQVPDTCLLYPWQVPTDPCLNPQLPEYVPQELYGGGTKSQNSIIV